MYQSVCVCMCDRAAYWTRRLNSVSDRGSRTHKATERGIGSEGEYQRRRDGESEQQRPYRDSAGELERKRTRVRMHKPKVAQASQD